MIEHRETEDGEVIGATRTNYGRAIERAVNDGVDILNVSHGNYDGTCAGDCGYCYHTREALNRDVTVVVAAGNREAEKPSVFCPAIEEDTVAVGGMIALCTNTENGCAPGAYQLGSTPYEPADRTYCGQQGCTIDSRYCIENLREQSWDGNPNPVNNKPDTLAPHHTIITNGSTGEIHPETGSSYASPVVTAAIAYAYSELRQQGMPTPNPYQIRRAIRDSSLIIHDTEIGKLDARVLTEQLLDLMRGQNAS